VSSRISTEKGLQFEIGHRRVPAFLKNDLTGGAPEHARPGILNPREFGYGRSCPRNDDLFSHLNPVQQAGEMGLRLVDIDFHTGELS
jgi:hypothetical protein